MPFNQTNATMIHHLELKNEIFLSGALREFRSIYNFSQEEMCVHFSVSLSTYRNWETGRSKPTKTNSKKIRKLLEKEIKKQ